MVHEFLAGATTHLDVVWRVHERDPQSDIKTRRSPMLTLISVWSLIALLCTCQFVHDEASRILRAMLQEFEQSDLTPKLSTHVDQDCNKYDNDEVANFYEVYILLELSIRFRNWAHTSVTLVQEEFMIR